MPNTAAKRITLDARSSRLVARLVKSGRYESEETAVRAAMRLLEDEERDFKECVAGIRRGMADAKAGRFKPADEVFARLDREIAKRRAK